MKKNIRMLDRDVLDMARERVARTFDTFDRVAVCFSGGKDSLVALHLCLAEAAKRAAGNTARRLLVVFRDEELIPNSVLDFVNEYRQNPAIDLRWYCVPLKSEKFVLGKTSEYVQWDPGRPWLRQKPEWGITRIPGYPENHVFSQYDMDAAISADLAGRVELVTGIRAAESIYRLRASINKKILNYVTATEDPRVKLVKPLYDWEELDIFKFLYEERIRYCSIYDEELFNGENLRVSTPLHAEQAKRLNQVRVRDPLFYQQVVDVFPEVKVQARYWSEFNRREAYGNYAPGWDGLLKYIEENIPDAAKRRLAVERVMMAYKIRRRATNGKPPCFGYPVLYVLKLIQGGGYKRVILPTSKPTKDELAYELLCGPGSDDLIRRLADG